MFECIKWKQSVIFAVFVILSPFIMFITKSFLSFMLGFNVFLAFIPLYLIWLIEYLLKRSDYKIKYYHIIIFIIFVLFFPNTFYIITDAIHINSSLFYTFEEIYSPTVYLRDISSYIMLFHILIAIFYGLYAGCESLLGVRNILLNLKLKPVINNIMLFMIIILSSVGIYIGRFMRFFSWDIFNPVKIISELFLEIDLFFFMFILLFTFTQLIIYTGYLHIKGSSKSSN